MAPNSGTRVRLRIGERFAALAFGDEGPLVTP